MVQLGLYQLSFLQLPLDTTHVLARSGGAGRGWGAHDPLVPFELASNHRLDNPPL